MKKPNNYIVNVKDINKNLSKDIFVKSDSFGKFIKNETLNNLEVFLFRIR